MALFLNQNERRTQLQEKIATELSDRAKRRATDEPIETSASMLEDSHEASGRSLFWVGIVTAAVIALVIFVLFVFK